MPLTDTAIRKMRPEAKTYRKADGGNLFIEVRPTGSKLWRLAYRFEGKQKLAAFGKYPEVSLMRAREKRLAAKTLLADGFDPVAKAKAGKAEQAALNEHTFTAIATELMEKLRKEGKADITLNKKQWLLDMAIADFGNMPITHLTTSIILDTVRKVEKAEKYETASRLRSTVGQVCRHAIHTGRAKTDPTYALKGALITPKVTHMAAAIERDAFTTIVRKVWAYEVGGPSTRAALKLMALLYSRPGEMRNALWEEFDLAKGVWIIPEERTKTRREHTKPLPKLAIEILEQVRRETGSNYRVFPSANKQDRPISENTMTQALRRMGIDQKTHSSHGFRASASSLLNESGLWNEDAIEAELSHIVNDQVRRAYNRTRYWEERVRMADWWAGEIKRMVNKE